MPIIIVKAEGDVHHTNDFDGATSDRIILPGKDGCNVKVTRFKPKAGFNMPDIVYDCDETVLVEEGQIQLYLYLCHDDEREFVLNEGEIYHVPAGVTYDLTAILDSKVFCVFSQAVGPLPDDK